MQDSIRRPGRRRGRTMLIAGLLSTVVIAAAGCSNGPKKVVAEVPASPSQAAAAPSGRPSGDPLAFSRCMRAHGISDFPDPSGKGFVDLPSDIDPNSQTFKKAQTACQKYVPQGASNQGSEQQQQGSAAQMLQYSRCMRANGILKYPDPDANGGLQITVDSGIDPNSQAFKKAQSACQKYQPQGARNTSPQPMSR
jgi:hypothetical protein